MNKAQEKNLPPYYIFNDITLNEIIAYKPTTIEELLAIKGFGPKKCDWYGEETARNLAYELWHYCLQEQLVLQKYLMKEKEMTEV